MFKIVRIAVLLFILFFVSVSSWLTQARSTDWEDSLWVKLYPINADGSQAAADYIAALDVADFEPIEAFIARETGRWGRPIERPVRIELGTPIREQPPAVAPGAGFLGVMTWSLKLRFWAGRVAGEQDEITPHIRIFVRYHSPDMHLMLENSVGLQKGMVGIVNAYAGRRQRGANQVIIAHELLHTLGASDKYDPATGQPVAPHGLGEPERVPLYPQRYAEIMGGRIALAVDDAVVPKSLGFALIGPLTASEIRLID
ncbi:MAG: hypothetical protein R3176_07375 [Woeseiaceae bacterium]|nr:hypothetical protein [Woeseiaceae bacterium]